MFKADTHLVSDMFGRNIIILPITIEHKNSIINSVSKVGKRSNIRNQYNQLPHLTEDTVWENAKYTRKKHIQERQEVTPFPAAESI